MLQRKLNPHYVYLLLGIFGVLVSNYFLPFREIITTLSNLNRDPFAHVTIGILLIGITGILLMGNNLFHIISKRESIFKVDQSTSSTLNQIGGTIFGIGCGIILLIILSMAAFLVFLTIIWK